MWRQRIGLQDVLFFFLPGKTIGRLETGTGHAFIPLCVSAPLRESFFPSPHHLSSRR